MTQEEKVRAYDEALEKAKSMIDDLRKGEDILAVSNLESMFPELKESEDEREELINYLKGIRFVTVESAEKVRNWIVWLEKQGEQKQDPCDNCKDVRLNCHNFPCIKKRAFEQGKSAFEVINEEDVDNANKVEQKSFWSEKDEHQLNNIYDVLDGHIELSEEGYKNAANWLKSIKQRYTWKPSDKQINAIRLARYFVTDDFVSDTLVELEEQLKKLK